MFRLIKITPASLLIIGMMFAVQVHAGPCAAVAFNDMTTSAGKDKCGFSENSCQVSTPPKIYLQQDNEDYASCNEGYYNQSDILSYDRLSCFMSVAESISGELTDSGGNTPFLITMTITTNGTTYSYDADYEAALWGGLQGAFTGIKADCEGYGTYTTNGSCSAMVLCGSGNGSCTVTNGGNIFNGLASSTTTSTLSSEYTDAMLQADVIALMPAYPNWSGDIDGANSAFFHWGDATHESCSGGKMKYRLHVTDCVAKETYLVKWDEITAYDGSTNLSISHLKEKVAGSGDPTTGVYTSEHEVPMPTTPGSIYEGNATVKVVPKSNGGGGGPGSGGPGSGPGGGPNSPIVASGSSN